jgi:hypothetical protein
MRIVALLIAAVPVVFGAVRLVSTGNDYRYLLTALAALAAAATVYGYGAARVQSRCVRAVLSLAASTLLGAAVAFGQGARSPGAVWFVSIGFALCVTAGGMLGLFSRRASDE